MLNFYCDTCNTVECKRCVQNSHKNHRVVTLGEKCRKLKVKLRLQSRVVDSQLASISERQDILRLNKEINEKSTNDMITEISKQYNFIVNLLSIIYNVQLTLIDDEKGYRDAQLEKEHSKLLSLTYHRNKYQIDTQRLLIHPVSPEFITLSQELLENDHLSLESGDFEQIIRKPTHIFSPQGSTSTCDDLLTKIKSYIMSYLRTKPRNTLSHQVKEFLRNKTKSKLRADKELMGLTGENNRAVDKFTLSDESEDECVLQSSGTSLESSGNVSDTSSGLWDDEDRLENIYYMMTSNLPSHQKL